VRAVILRILLGMALLMLPMALAGCAVFQPPRGDVAGRVRVVAVDRAVPVGCVDVASLPETPDPVGARLNGEARHDAAILAQALLAERGVRDRAMALLRGCVQ